MASSSPARRRGRPPGSPSLTKEIEDTIVSYVASGATLAAAAAAAEISPRTLRDWLSRGEERHPSRRCTAKLRRFAKRLRRAQAEARIVAENRVYKENPKAWLAVAARSTPDDEGWSASPAVRSGPAGRPPEIASLSDEELNSALQRLLLVAGERLGASPGDVPQRSRREAS